MNKECKCVEWNGEWFPPIGWVGEYKPYWHPCEIVTVHNGYTVVWDMKTREYFRTKDPTIFRSTRTPEQRAIDAMIRVVIDETSNEYSDVETGVPIIYAAIRDGRIPGVKLENEDD